MRTNRQPGHGTHGPGAGTEPALKSTPDATDAGMVIRSAPVTRLHRASSRSRVPGRSRVGGGLLCALLVLATWGPSVTPAAAAGTFTFSGSGWGHGVGMSQWGARGMAAQGSSATDILTRYYSGTAVTPVATSDIRVLVGSAASFTVTPGAANSFIQLFGPVIGTTTAAVTITNSGGTIVLGGGVSGTATALVVPLGGAPLRLSPPGYRYVRGTLIITPDGAGLRAVVAGLSMQEYLYGLGEMPSSWPAAALQAQAVAARTYAQKKVNAVAGGGSYDIVGGLPDQSYLGWDKEGATMGAQWVAAVDATDGQAVTYEGRLIDAVYSASSGGQTENSEVVWVSAVPYLRSVSDPADLTGGNPNASWVRSYSGTQLGTWFGLGEVTSVQVLGPLGASGRVDKATVRLIGTAGSRDVLGSLFRSTVNANSPAAQLMSTRFSVGGPTAPPPPPPPPPPPNTLPFGVLDVARADRRTIVVAGRALDPEGAPLVRIVSTMGSQVATREVRTVNGQFAAMWTGSPGTRSVCVTVLDTPTGQGVGLGCRNVIVK